MEKHTDTVAEYINEFIEKLENPVHKRVIGVYQTSDDPTSDMRAEIDRIVLEIFEDD